MPEIGSFGYIYEDNDLRRPLPATDKPDLTLFDNRRFSFESQNLMLHLYEGKVVLFEASVAKHTMHIKTVLQPYPAHMQYLLMFIVNIDSVHSEHTTH